MAIIAQRKLFSWKEVEVRSDLDRLEMVLRVLPDEELMRTLERDRNKGRDDYPVRAVWNSLLAAVVYEHGSVESLRRELQRNGELRDLCGFDAMRGDKAVPPASAYSRFLKNVFEHQEQIEGMFDELLERLRVHLLDLGKHLAVDSKGIRSHGKPTQKGRDGRREVDAGWGVKRYCGQREDGSLWERVVKWFGYKVHLIVDVVYEMPLGWEVTRASVSDTTRLLPMMEELARKRAWVLERAEDMSGDRGYDSTENNRELQDQWRIKPIIDIRRDWKDGEETRPLFWDRVDNVVTDERGSVFCVRGESETVPMAFCGFENNRGTLKYRCPAAAYGMECCERSSCSPTDYGRVVRVPMELDRRRFVPVPRDSHKWKRLYRGRTAVERVNSRLDVSFGFERHFIRGIQKMRFRVGLALVVMLAMALGAIEAKREEQMRSLVWSPKARKAA
jgi:hypothetical protein